MPDILIYFIYCFFSGDGDVFVVYADKHTTNTFELTSMKEWSARWKRQTVQLMCTISSDEDTWLEGQWM